MIEFTNKEKKFLAALSSRKEMTLGECQEFWATPLYVTQKLKRLNTLGIVKLTETCKVIPTESFKENLINFLK